MICLRVVLIKIRYLAFTGGVCVTILTNSDFSKFKLIGQGQNLTTLVLFLLLPAIKSWLNRVFRKSLNMPTHQYTIKEGNCTEKILCMLTVAKRKSDKKVRAFFTYNKNKMSLWSLQLKWVSSKLFEIQLNCLHFHTKVNLQCTLSCQNFFYI